MLATQHACSIIRMRCAPRQDVASAQPPSQRDLHAGAAGSKKNTCVGSEGMMARRPWQVLRRLMAPPGKDDLVQPARLSDDGRVAVPVRCRTLGRDRVHDASSNNRKERSSPLLGDDEIDSSSSCWVEEWRIAAIILFRMLSRQDRWERLPHHLEDRRSFASHR